jgi:hypothetical protein
MSIDGQITQHLLVELFAKTSELLKQTDPTRKSEILQAHDEFQSGILNLRELLLAYPRDGSRLSKNG